MFLVRMVIGALFVGALQANAQKPVTAGKQSAEKAVAPKTYVTTLAKAGEDLPALLTRYGLYAYECNRTQFLKLNNLKKGSAIKTAVTYKLPVEVVDYNGKSIRSTLNIDDWKVAKRIESYNKFAFEEGLRSDNFLQTKRLWVPWHELQCPGKAEAVAAEASLEDTRKQRPVPPGLGEKSIGGASAREYPVFGKKYHETRTDIV